MNQSDSSAPALLQVSNLSVDARTPEGLRPVLRNVSFTLQRGETLCIAGESGSGKSVTSLAVMGLLPKSSLKITSGSVKLEGKELLHLPNREMRKIRGGDIAMIFQEPMTSLNPVMTVGAQMVEAIREHDAAGGSDPAHVARRMLEAVHMTEPARRLTQYPHELSGGMRQRVMIAMALSCQPKVMIADEPTTALDVTVQAQILKLMRELKTEFGTSIILITHDMGVVAEMADRVFIMQSGRCVEEGSAERVFNKPQEPYTRELLAAVLRLGSRKGTEAPPQIRPSKSETAEATPVLEVQNLSVSYGAARSWFGAGKAHPPVVRNVSFSLRQGQTLGLVGESGSGKSTTGKAILGLVPFKGLVRLNGHDIRGLSARDMQPIRRSAQMIFQDPYASLDPRMAVGDAVAEPLIIHGLATPAERLTRVADLLQRVGLPADAATRYPHEFSGGQRQRICIARSLALNPKLIVADESVAALDVSVRAKVLDLMLELQQTLNLSYLFISHDMAVIEHMSHQVAVMKAGEIVEIGSRRAVFESPQSEYTQTLMAAVPLPVVQRTDI